MDRVMRKHGRSCPESVQLSFHSATFSNLIRPTMVSKLDKQIISNTVENFQAII